MYFSEFDTQAALDQILLEEMEQVEVFTIPCSVTQNFQPCDNTASWYIKCSSCKRLIMPMCDSCRPHVEAHIKSIEPFKMYLCCGVFTLLAKISFKPIAGEP